MQTPGAAAPGLGAAACILLYQLTRLALLGLLRAAGCADGGALQWGCLLAATLLAALPPLVWAWNLLPPGRRRWTMRRPRQPVPAALPLYLAILAASSLLARLFGTDPGSGVSLPTGRLALALAFLQLCVASPLAEELVFRGAAQRLLAPYGAAAAVVCQAAVFAALHGGAAQAAFALPTGLLFGWAAWRSGSLWPGLALHGLNNTILFFGLLAGGAA